MTDHSSYATAEWSALGTTVLVRVDDARVLDAARATVSAVLEMIDRAASRFRDDSELERANAMAGRVTPISPLLHEAIGVAVDAARMTDGAVDPTVGRALLAAGYTRDWHELDHPEPGEPAAVGPDPISAACRGADWSQVRLSTDPLAVLLPRGVRLDLGATAKALAADRAAARASAASGGVGVLVSLGGDIALAGRVPAGGWLIHVTDDHRGGPDAPGQTVALSAGGLATSSITTRRWRHQDRVMHHILEPRTGAPALGVWRTVSVAAGSCLQANIASTAAIVKGHGALPWLAAQGVPARLVSMAGDVRRVNGWPASM